MVSVCQNSLDLPLRNASDLYGIIRTGFARKKMQELFVLIPLSIEHEVVFFPPHNTKVTVLDT